MVDEQEHERAWREALEEILARFEQGEVVSEEQFEELVRQLEERHEDYRHEDSPLREQLRLLRERAAKLEESAAEGTGPTDQVSSILAPLTGSDAKAD